MASLKISLLLASLACVGCETTTAPSQQRATKVDPKSAKVPLDEPPNPPAGLTEDRLRSLIHAPGGADRDLLFRLLTGDAAARRWAPLGLSLICDEASASKTENHLVAAAAAWLSGETPPKASELRTLAWAIGVCASPSAEDVLRAWLTPEPAAEEAGLIEAGVFGLAALADRRGKLSERTQATLLETASRENRPDLLLPLGRVGRLSDAVGAHILEVAGTLLTQKERSGRRQALYALGGAGPSAAAPLAQVLLSESYTPEERAAAAQSLTRLGGVGQEALDESLRDLLKRGLPTSYERELWIVLRAIIDGLAEAEASRAELAKLSAVVLPDGKEREKVAQRRRMIWLRCQAARLLSGERYDSPALLGCDPEQGRAFQLVRLEVLGRQKLKGARGKKYHEILESDDPVVFQAALRMLAAHPEVGDTPELLEKALRSATAGTVATAAQLISAYPNRAHDDEADGGPREGIVGALKSLLDPENGSVANEARAAAISAAGALGALSLKPEVEALCQGSAEALWDPAKRALGLLGSPGAKCPKENTGEAISTPHVGKVTLVAETDVGQLLLHLDGTDAPLSAAHFLEKVDAGYYDGIAIHGGRAGFAVQFGDQDGDGYQDGASEGLPHEVSPRPFQAKSFGMSAFSPGSQDTQIFVVLSDAPQLYGSRVHLGQAEGPWHLLVVGDVIHSLKRK